ncbi:porin family protein [uncultured Bacteroides sp.]|uniref:porin family protein n=1 Tax=uncultured Bacteroides sp. TaxID=162156 RepID=UPI00262F4A60|nr:porin family protein [uncultured Bacteroides sp.]
MKRQAIVILAAICCLLSIPVHAQLQDQRHNFSVGVNGGVNLSSVSFDPSIKQNNLIGPEFGVTLRYVSEKYFKMICGIQMEINYSQRGWKEKIEDESGDSYQRAMNYLEIPILAHLAFGKDKGYGVRFVVNLGPQVGFLLSEKTTQSAEFHPEMRPNGVTAQYDMPAEVKFDYGLIGGVGLEIRTGIGSFLAEGRYYFGLSDFYNSTKKDYFSRSAHSYIGARITYLFDITK